MAKDLSSLISLATSEMKNHGYSDKTIYCAYSYIWNKFAFFLNDDMSVDQDNINLFLSDYFNEDLFLKKTNKLTFNQRRYIRALDFLLRVYNGVEINRSKLDKIEYIMNDELKNVFDSYISSSIDDGNSESTIENKKRIIKLFIEETDFNNPQSQRLLDFLKKHSHESNIHLSIKNRLIRRFLIFCYNHKYISLDILNTWPISFKDYSDTHIPSEYSPDEINDLLICANDFKGEDHHLRNYAILCLLAYTGIRARDVCELRFNNISWNENLITITQHKTGLQIKIPIIPQYGNPLIKYILNERQNSDSEYIFLNEKNTCLKSNDITLIINRFFTISNIDIGNRHYGPHSLRHSFGTNLLNNGTAVFDVAHALGHNSTESVHIYAKVNLSQLRKCVLEALYE